MHLKRLRRIFVLIAAGVFYASSPAQTFKEASAATSAVAEPYFEAYIARNWEKLEPMLAENGRFTDPTAQPVFGKVEHTGRQAVMKNFREGYAAITHMHFNRSRFFYSGTHAVFEGTLDWNLKLANGQEAKTKGMPFITILRVEGGLVQEHQDYADYQPFIEAHRKAKSEG